MQREREEREKEREREREREIRLLFSYSALYRVSGRTLACCCRNLTF